MSSLASFNAR